MSLITFSTCWYNFKAKFDASVYHSWIHNMLSNVNNYYLVIYTDLEGSSVLQPYSENPRIRIIIKPYTDFYYYQHKDKWTVNHQNNIFLNNHIDWRLNMLWAEKTQFVYETLKNKYFDTEFYGWCDIGYFRARPNLDSTMQELAKWPNQDKIANLAKDKIYYGLVNNNKEYIELLYYLIVVTVFFGP